MRAPHRSDGENVPDAEVLGRNLAGLTCLDESCDPHPKIERIALIHDPPPVRESGSQSSPRRSEDYYILSNVLVGPLVVQMMKMSA